MMFTKDWNFNENFLGMVWNTGLCAGHDPYEGGDKTAGQLLFEAMLPQVEEQMKDEANQSLNEKLNEQGFDLQIDQFDQKSGLKVGTDI
jgi:hypothetical protein